MSLIRRALERRTVWSFGGIEADPNRIPRNSEVGFSSAGIAVSESSVLQLSAVTACVSLIADAIATLPLDAYRRGSDGARLPVAPVPALVADPFVDAEGYEGIYQLLYSLLMRGNGYVLVAERDAMQRATKLRVIHPDRVTRTRDGGYRVDRKPVTLHAEIEHVRGFTVPGMLEGLGPVDFARAGLGLGLAQQEYAARFFSRDATPGIVIEIPADVTDEAVLERIVANWRKHHQGWGRAHEPGVLTAGAHAKQYTITPEQAQFLESRRFQVAEIARWFRVPPHMIGDVDRSTSWGKGIEAQGRGFVTYTLAPWLVRIERLFTRLLPRPQYCKFNVAALLRADLLTRYEAYERARNASFLNVDEIRALEDMPPLPDGAGQSYIQPLNYGPLSPPRKRPEPDDDDKPDPAA